MALADRQDKNRESVAQVLARERGSVVIPAPVTAEVDYLLGERLGESSRIGFLQDLAAERFLVECLTAEDYGVVLELERRYTALSPGLADLSLVVVAARARTQRLLTFDQRHFRAIQPLEGGTFTLLPADC